MYRQPGGSIPLFILLGMLASTLLWVLSIASITAWYLELHNYVQLRCVHSNMTLIFTCMLCVVCCSCVAWLCWVALVIPWNPGSGCTSIPWRFEILIVKHKYKDNIDGNRLKQGWWWQATCPASYFLFPPPPLTFLVPAAHPLVETKETIGSKSVF